MKSILGLELESRAFGLMSREISTREDTFLMSNFRESW